MPLFQFSGSLPILLSNSKITFFCSSASADQWSSISRCSAVNEIGASPSSKNCDSVMPKPLHIFSSDWIVGVCRFRYQPEIVDCGKPDRFANSYSVQSRLIRSRSISLRAVSFFSDYLRILYLFIPLIFRTECSIINYS